MIFSSFLYMGLLALFSGLCVIAAWNDIRNFRLPNKIILMITLLFIPMALLHLNGQEVLNHMGIAALVLFVSFLLFILKFCAAGDSKFLAAVALWAGPSWVIEMLVVMSLAGGIVAIIQLIRSHFIVEYALGRFNMRLVDGGLEKLNLPYGVAITAGALTVTYLQLEAFFAASQNGLGG